MKMPRAAKKNSNFDVRIISYFILKYVMLPRTDISWNNSGEKFVYKLSVKISTIHEEFVRSMTKLNRRV